MLIFRGAPGFGSSPFPLTWRHSMTTRTSLLLAALLGAGAAQAAPTVVNADFEAPQLVGVTHAYQDKYDLEPGQSQDLSGHGWFYNGSTGLVAEGDFPFVMVDANGVQAGFLRGTNGEPYSAISQQVAGFDTGSYTLSFDAALWLDAGPNPLIVTLDGNALTFGGSATVTPSGNGFTAYTSDAITLLAGTHYLMFSGQSASDNKVATFIDDVSFQSVSAVPEPSTYALMVLGLAAVAGVNARRKRQG
jgi:hypothetical protein